MLTGSYVLRLGLMTAAAYAALTALLGVLAFRRLTRPLRRLAVRMRGAWDQWRRPGTRVAEEVEYLPPPQQGQAPRPPRVVVWRF